MNSASSQIVFSEQAKKDNFVGQYASASMKKSIILLLHGGFWLGNLLLLLLILGVLCQGDLIDETEGLYFLKVAVGVILVPGLCSFYGFYHFLFPNYLQKRQNTSAVLCGLGISLLSACAGAIVLYFLLDFVYSCYQESNFIALPIMMTVGLIYGVIAIIIKGFITWYEELKVKEALQVKNHEMEMALVKSQLDPHFLFNTINNIDILILKDSEQASHYLNKLSAIMRFMLFETKTDEISLIKEIEYIEKYIELQKIRTANPDYVNYSITGDLAGRRIAPMVFIPFIENAFKHSRNKKIKNAITVQISVSPSQISLMCKNKFDPNRKVDTDSNGLGNELIIKRLKLIYPNQHTLTMTTQEDIYLVDLTIDHA